MRFRAASVLLLAPLLCPVSSRADTYRLTLPRQSAAPVSFGAAELARALAEAGHRPGRGPSAVAITVGINAAAGMEGFTIQRRDATVRVIGGDAVGAMYGLLEVGEQVTEGAGRRLRQAVRPAAGRPYLSLRADSPTLALGSGGELPPILTNGAFWQQYVAGLARGQFNVLHLHGFLDPATGLSHSLLERLMPAAGAPDAGARRALRGLAELAVLCRGRGLRLAVTDDAAADAPAPAASARRLLAAVPGLWGLGARATGPGASLVLSALARAVPPSRQFLAWPDTSTAAGESATLPPRVLLSLPLNAGSFGLPYPLIPAPDASPTPRSLAAGDSPPAEPAAVRSVGLSLSGGTRLVWDVPAGRAAPSLPWWDPDFIRRLVRASAMRPLISTRVHGLLIEPPSSLFSAPPSSWWWHQTWGRLAYNPAEPDHRLEARFRRRFGSEPGERIARALARASTVVPLIAAIHAGSGAPEREPGTLEEWAAAPTLDPHALIDVRAWAEQRQRGEKDGRLGPVQVSFHLAETAMRLRGEVDTIGILKPRRPDEWRELRRRIEALCHLADFAARRLSTAAHLELHRRTGDEMELALAAGQAPLAAASWAAMQRLLAPGGEREMGRFTTGKQTGTGSPGIVEHHSETKDGGSEGHEDGTPAGADSSRGPAPTAESSATMPLPPGLPDAPLPGPPADPPTAPSTPEAPFAADTATITALRADLARQFAGAAPMDFGWPARRAADDKEGEAPPAPGSRLRQTAPHIIHVPAQHGIPTRSLRINATVISSAAEPRVTLIYRLVRGEAGDVPEDLSHDGAIRPERELPMTRLFATQAFYQAEIPGTEIAAGFLEYRIRAAIDADRLSAWPGAAAWRRVPVTQDEAGPTLQPLPPSRLAVPPGSREPSRALSPGISGRGAPSVTLVCEANDPAGVARVKVWVRPLASAEAWRALDMTAADSRYTAELPLTAAGFQYSFEAADTWGNVSRAPDVRTATPYLLLPPAPE